MRRILVEQDGQLAQYILTIKDTEIDTLIATMQADENYVTSHSCIYTGFLRKNQESDVDICGNRQVSIKKGPFSYETLFQRIKYPGAYAFLRELKLGREARFTTLFDLSVSDDLSMDAFSKCVQNPDELITTGEVDSDGKNITLTRMELMAKHNPSIQYFVDHIMDHLGMADTPKEVPTPKTLARHNTQFVTAVRQIQNKGK